MRDYSTISPSAKSLLLTKGLTDIPYITAATKLVWDKETLTEFAHKATDNHFLRRLIHFEERYKSLDSILNQFECNNFLEISSGFSFRGLHYCAMREGINYIDTDLPEVINTKSRLTHELITLEKIELKSNLITSAMNALDEVSFENTVDQLPKGPLALLNEGLLMYLNTDEKTRLCHIIRRVLKERGGYWLTADIYIKRDKKLYDGTDQISRFLAAHNVEENKFESFEQAGQFFNDNGLKLYKKAAINWETLSSLRYLPAHAVNELKNLAAQYGRIRETWALISA